MGVLVADAPAQGGGSLIVGVLQIGRNGQVPALFHFPHGSVNGLTGRIGLGGRGHVFGGHGQNDLGLWHADALAGKGGVDRHHQGVGVGVSHILAGADHDAPCNEFRLFPGTQHSGQIIDGGVRIGSPHAFYKGRNSIVVIISLSVIADHPLLYALLCLIQGDVDLSVRRPGRGQDAQLDGVEGMSGVSARKVRQKDLGVLVDDRIVSPHAPFLIVDGPFYQDPYVLHGQGL